MKTENKKSSSLLFSAVIAIVISMVLSVGFTLMLGSTFGIGFSIKRLVFASFLTAVVFAAVFFFNKTWVSFSAIMTAPTIFALCLYKGWFDVKAGFMALLYYVKLYVFLWLPGDYAEDVDANKTVLAFFIAYNLIAISVTVFVVMKRKWIPSAIVFYMPLFLCSVTNTDLSPKAAPCLLAGAGTILLLFCNAFRHKKQSTYERMLIILTVPVILFMFLLGAIFPQKTYNKDKLARNIIIETRDWLDKTAGRDNPLRDILERALNGFENTDFDNSFDSVSPLYATPTNLNKVGPFNPTSDEILKVYRYTNPDYTGVKKIYSGNVLYLKVESLDTYQNNTLSSARLKMNPYKKNFEQENESAPYWVSVTALKSSSVDIVPYYTDFYYMPRTEVTNLNPYGSTHRRIFSFASSNVPVKTGDIYSDEYLKDYVYKTCLEVPYSTDRALIFGGNLPKWYTDVYNGNTQMSDYEKVRNVTDFVRSLHHYDLNTKYPPKGADFVPWFVNEGESGICVHYAVTSVVLLRMIGVPARYVRGFVDTNSQLDGESTVLASQAHAWFEVFIPEYGWVMGDATPGYNSDESNFNVQALAQSHPDVKSADFGKRNNPENTAATETSETTEATTTAETTSETSEGETTAPSDKQSQPSSKTPSGSAENYTGSYTIEDLPADKNVLPEFLMRAFKLFMAVFICVSAAAVIALVFRALFMLFWTNRFNSGKINERALAHYHYYMLMSRIFRFIYPEMVKELAEKATFSGRDISQKEYESLIKTCRQIMNTSSVDFTGIKKVLFRLMRI